MAISDGQGYTLRRVGRLGVGGEGIERYGYTPELPVDNRTKSSLTVGATKWTPSFLRAWWDKMKGSGASPALSSLGEVSMSVTAVFIDGAYLEKTLLYDHGKARIDFGRLVDAMVEGDNTPCEALEGAPVMAWSIRNR